MKSNAFFVVAVQILIKNVGGHLETSGDQGIAVSLEPAKISEESEALQFFPLRLQQVGFRINKLVVGICCFSWLAAGQGVIVCEPQKT